MAAQTTQLNSSALASASYDDETQSLTVTFTNGRSYTYDGVGEELFLGLRDAPSPGRYYFQNIKPLG